MKMKGGIGDDNQIKEKKNNKILERVENSLNLSEDCPKSDHKCKGMYLHNFIASIHVSCECNLG